MALTIIMNVMTLITMKMKMKMMLFFAKNNAVLCTTCSSAVLHLRLIYILAVYRQYIGKISELAMNISFENISAIYRDWLHSLGTRSAVKILKVSGH